MADVRWPTRGRNDKHDDAECEHREPHEFKYQRVHGDPSAKPLDLQGSH
jgi:hypothetical protein